MKKKNSDDSGTDSEVLKLTSGKQSENSGC